MKKISSKKTTSISGVKLSDCNAALLGNSTAMLACDLPFKPFEIRDSTSSVVATVCAGEQTTSMI
jgi:hypothetical protein